ncbi:hypothetical protein Nepgr_010947 [Nepenthes gracilis]|uniref:Uncharacterized protein n=1 Tax=Nepenthes gracilis TaxID=150966 RepID=A0AAD3SED4_NEPGR|nr:hypothetical protein Nepgr_010947 [Nepenthes gracilis]
MMMGGIRRNDANLQSFNSFSGRLYYPHSSNLSQRYHPHLNLRGLFTPSDAGADFRALSVDNSLLGALISWPSASTSPSLSQELRVRPDNLPLSSGFELCFYRVSRVQNDEVADICSAKFDCNSSRYLSCISQ